MKTPEEIKTALKALIPIDPNAGEIVMTPFQYFELARIHIAAHKYILHLEKKYDEVFRLCGDLHHDMLEQRERGDRLEAERDAAVKDMYEAQSIVCLICKNHYQPDPAVKKYGCKEFGEFYPEEGAIVCGKFEWRGVQKEE